MRILRGKETGLDFLGRLFTLRQRWLEVFVTVGDSAALAFSGALIVSRRSACPVRESVLVTEMIHIDPGFSNDLFRAHHAYTGDSAKSLYSRLLLFGQRCKNLFWRRLHPTMPTSFDIFERKIRFPNDEFQTGSQQSLCKALGYLERVVPVSLAPRHISDVIGVAHHGW